MSTKRILAAILGTLMLVALAVPAFAYTTPYATVQDNTSHVPGITADGSSQAFYFGNGASVTPSGNNYTMGATFTGGAMNISLSAAKTWKSGAVASANAASARTIGATGTTVDLYANLTDLPNVTSDTYLTDAGSPTGNWHHGFVIESLANTTVVYKNPEIFISFVDYDNEAYGTDAALVVCGGNRLKAAAEGYANVFFFYKPTEYARYTLTFDVENGTTDFWIDGSQEDIFLNDLGEYAPIEECSYMHRASQAASANGDWCYIDMKFNTANTSGSANISLDQLNIYPEALIPAAEVARFEGDPEVGAEPEEPAGPSNANFTNAYNYFRDWDGAIAEAYYGDAFWSAFEGWINYGLELIADGDQDGLNAHSDSGVNGNWFLNRLAFITTAGLNVKTGGSAATVNGTGTVVPAASVVTKNVNRYYISHIDTDGQNIPWSYSSTIITAPVNTCTDVTSFGGGVNTTVWRAYIFEPTNVDGYFKLIDVGGNASGRTTIPEGGFGILTHINSKNVSSAATSASIANAEPNKYNSVPFHQHQVQAVYNAGLTKGGYVKLEGVDLTAGTIDTEGTWITYKDPALTEGSHVYREGYVPLATADAEGRTTTTRDLFEDFVTNAYVTPVAELPVVGEQVNVTVKGEGSVTAAINGTDTALDNIVSVAGATVTLTANGEGFKYWIDGNKTILSTDAVLTIPGGKALNITAVFEDAAEAETYNVYFKDSKTGKIWATKSVAAGTALDTTDVTAALKGYTFAGWTVENGTIINGTTEVYSKYEKDPTATALTIVDGSYNVTIDRAYGTIAAVSARGENFSYWTLNGKIVSVDADFQFNMASTACTLEAVYGADAPAAVAAVVDASKVDSTIYFLMSRSVKEGTIKETGVLMTRKASASDLTVDTTVNTVTKGISTADAEYDVVGFVKDAAGKAGTWLVKGYVTYELNDATYTVYTDVASIEIA